MIKCKNEKYEFVQAVGSLMSIKRVGPGKLPKELSGMYTSYTFANEAIDTYEANKNGKNNAGSETD